MSNLLLPRRFYNQPQGAVQIDWSNPLTLDLGALVTVGGGGLREHCTNTFAVGGAGTSTVSTSEDGIARRIVTGGDRFNTGSNLSTITQYSLFALQKIDIATSGGYPGLFAKQRNGTSQALEVWRHNGNGLTYVQHGGTSTVLSNFSNGINTEKLSFQVITWDGSVVRAYLDGVLRDSVSFSASIPSGVGVYSALSRVASEVTSGIYYITGCSARCFSQPEVASISANPWQIFKVSE